MSELMKRERIAEINNDDTTSEPYTEDSDGIPQWGSPVSQEEALEAFCKVVRFWTDHQDMDGFRVKLAGPNELGTVGEFVNEGLGFLWYFVVAVDRDENGKVLRAPCRG